MVDSALAGENLLDTATTTVATADSSIHDSFARNNFFGLFTMPADFLSIAYATTVALGGVMGYATKGEMEDVFFDWLLTTRFICC